jgi:short subunit dehydrogenase-like uncharacterized protein
MGVAMSARAPAVVVLGATGYTGRLIAREAAGAGVPTVLAARDADRLAAVAAETGLETTRLVDVTDRSSLDGLICRGDAVVNTAGPFTELGEPVVQACVEAGAHYLDTAGEQPFMHTVWERYHAAARDAGVAVVNAMAFEFAMGDCAAAVAARDLGPLRSLDVVYSWAGSHSSRGTRRTILRMIGARAWERRHGEFRPLVPGARHRRVTFASGRTLHAVAFGAGELLTAPRHLDVEDASGWIALGSPAARLVPFVSPALPRVVPLLRPVLEPLVARAPEPTVEQRAASGFTIRLELEAMDGSRRAVEVQGADPYGITALAAVHGARRAMEVGGPVAFLDKLGERDLRLVWDGGPA